MEEMEVNHVAEIQEKLSGMVGDRVKVKANMGRTRVIERLGIIKNVHPAVFIIEVDERRGRKSRQSYQYVDVLTGTVELFDPETGEHIFKFRVPLHGKVELKAVAGDCIDTASFCSVAEPNPSYKLVKTKSKSANWV